MFSISHILLNCSKFNYFLSHFHLKSTQSVVFARVGCQTRKTYHLNIEIGPPKLSELLTSDRTEPTKRDLGSWDWPPEARGPLSQAINESRRTSLTSVAPPWSMQPIRGLEDSEGKRKRASCSLVREPTGSGHQRQKKNPASLDRLSIIRRLKDQTCNM
jgi:hypothetical protein